MKNLFINLSAFMCFDNGTKLISAMQGEVCGTADLYGESIKIGLITIGIE